MADKASYWPFHRPPSTLWCAIVVTVRADSAWQSEVTDLALWMRTVGRRSMSWCLCLFSSNQIKVKQTADCKRKKKFVIGYPKPRTVLNPQALAGRAVQDKVAHGVLRSSKFYDLSIFRCSWRKFFCMELNSIGIVKLKMYLVNFHIIFFGTLRHLHRTIMKLVVEIVDLPYNLHILGC